MLVRDVRMQGRWLKKQLKKLSSKKEVVDLLKKSCEVDPTDMTPRVEQVRIINVIDEDVSLH